MKFSCTDQPPSSAFPQITAIGFRFTSIYGGSTRPQNALDSNDIELFA